MRVPASSRLLLGICLLLGGCTQSRLPDAYRRVWCEKIAECGPVDADACMKAEPTPIECPAGEGWTFHDQAAAQCVSDVEALGCPKELSVPESCRQVCVRKAAPWTVVLADLD
jgi:hypothetical protein